MQALSATPGVGVLSMRAVSVSAGSVKILQQVSLTLQPGQLCALIGPSGAGKSTLMKVLLGLIDPDQGSVTLGGGPVAAAGPIGYVPQTDALHRTLSVRRALDFALQLRAPDWDAQARQARIAQVCSDVGLTERVDVRIKKLSGGQRKRVSLALELLTNPKVMVLDEPTSGLDPGLEARMMALLLQVAQQGRIVLVATHAMQSLSKVDQLVVLHAGQLAFAGAPAEALRFFRAESFEAIFGHLPKLEPHVWARRFSRGQW